VNTDRNLLFGVLAVQLEYIDASQFADVCAAWAMRKNTTVADILVERGWITPEARQEVEGLLARKMDKHEGDARKALGDVADPSVRDAMRDVGDDEVDETLDHLEPPSGFVRVLDTVDFSPEERSHYTLSRVHTQGGLGRVWLAHDKRLHREVALKEIRPDKKVSELSQRRFVREAQITGQLEHPNIVPVYELADNLDKERPFYTMRFLRGQSLGAAIDEYHRQRKAGKATRFDLRRLLNAFVNVCHAVAYAHSKGVVHRDMKPANVMLGAFGEVVLLDWGLAKLVDRPDVEDEEPSPIEVTEVDDDEATRVGQLVGTLPYMAPEQAKGQPGQIDARTDIYGLGASLFRILSGRRPHHGKSKDEVCANIVRQPTPRPREVDASIPKALDAICSKAMAEKRSDRYQDATALAVDVQRWMADDPVSVYREAWHEKFARWTRKHRTLALVSAIALFLVAVVASVALVFIEGARREANDAWDAEKVAKAEAVDAWNGEKTARTAAEKAEGEANEARGTAVKWLEHAIDAVDSMLVGVTQVLPWYPGTQELLEQLLEQAERYYEGFAAEDVNDPELRVHLAHIRVRLGDVRRQLQKAESAEQAFRDADAILAELEQTASDEIDVRLDRTICLRKLGDACAVQSRYGEATKAFDQAASLAERLTSSADRGYQHSQLLLSRALVSLGAEDVETAETLLRRAEAELRALIDAGEGDEVNCRQALAMVNSTLGEALTAAGRDDEAIEPLKNAKEAHRKLREVSKKEEDNPSHIEGLVVANIRLANALRTSGRTDEELVALKDAIHDCDVLLEAMPDIPRFREERAVAQVNLARVLNSEYLNDEAKTRADDALGVFTELSRSPFNLPRHHRQLAIGLMIRGQIVRDLHDPETAAKDFHNAIQGYLRLMEIEQGVFSHVLEAAMTSREHGRLLHLIDGLESAKDEYTMAAAAFQNVLKQKPDDRVAIDGLASCLEQFGELMQDMQKPDEAQKLYQEALLQRKRLPEFPMYEFRKASLLLKLDEAAETLAIAEKLVDGNPDNAAFATVLGAAQLQAGNADRCIGTLEGLTPELRERAGPELEFWLAMAHSARGEPGDAEKARELFNQAVERMNALAPGCVALLRLHTEAAALLGIADTTAAPKPKVVEGPPTGSSDGSE